MDRIEKLAFDCDANVAWTSERYMADTDEFRRIADDVVKSALDSRAEREAMQEASIASLVKTSEELSSNLSDLRTKSFTTLQSNAAEVKAQLEDIGSASDQLAQQVATLREQSIESKDLLQKL
eukprot:COSAG02_NODE_29838_length_562_cov_0.652268_1_plen_122_part_10